MAYLRGILEFTGLQSVQTYIQSGNIICETDLSDEKFNQLVALLKGWTMQRFLQQSRKIFHIFHGKSRKQTGKRTTDNDQKGGWVIHGRDRRPLEDHADEDREYPHSQTDDG